MVPSLKSLTIRQDCFFDIGINLDESNEVQVPEIDGLFCGVPNCDGVFISHYHSDHLGLTDKLLDGIPVFMGEKACEIITAAANYREKQIPITP